MKTEHWKFWLLAGVLVAGSFAAAVHPLPGWILSKTRPMEGLTALEAYEVEAQIREALLQALGGAFIVLASLAALRQYALARSQAEVDRHAKFVEAFTRAVEQLGSEKAAVRVAGVYALERLSEFYDADYDRVTNILASYVRETVEDESGLGSVATAVRLLSRRKHPHVMINISGARLVGAKLDHLRFEKFRMTNCDLRRADLSHSILSECDLTGADLSNSRLHGADLRKSQLDGSRFVNARTDAATRGCPIAHES